MPWWLRTDIVGIMAILAVAGYAQAFTSVPASLEATTRHVLVANLWTASLCVFGTIGFLASLCPKRWQVMALGVEAVCRVVLALMATAYSLALWDALGWGSARFAIFTYAGLAITLLVGAYQIFRWLITQRRAVNRALGDR